MELNLNMKASESGTAQISRSLTPLVQISHFSRCRKTFAHDMLASVELQHIKLCISLTVHDS